MTWTATQATLQSLFPRSVENPERVLVLRDAIGPPRDQERVREALRGLYAVQRIVSASDIVRAVRDAERGIRAPEDGDERVERVRQANQAKRDEAHGHARDALRSMGVDRIAEMMTQHVGHGWEPEHVERYLAECETDASRAVYAFAMITRAEQAERLAV